MDVRIIFFLVFTAVAGAHGQQVQTSRQASQIEGNEATGYQVAVSAQEDDVRTSLSRYLKEIGKTKSSGDYLVLSDPVLRGRKYSQMLYAAIKPGGTSTEVWFGMAATGEESDFERALEQLAHDFGVYFYRQKIQLQVDESLRALQAVEKQQLKLLNQNKDLEARVENNKREKIQLEKALVENKAELEDLQARLDGNAKARDSVAIAGEQIRKVVEMHKDRQRKVN